jgi:hypothetical protein
LVSWTGKSTKKTSASRKRAANDEEQPSSPPPKKRRKKSNFEEKEKPKRKPRTPAKRKAKVSNVDYTDVGTLKKEREEYTSDFTFDNARRLFTKDGAWQLHTNLTDRFKEVALQTLKNINKVDRYDVFANPVSEEDVPDYYDTIKNRKSWNVDIV